MTLALAALLAGLASAPLPPPSAPPAAPAASDPVGTIREAEHRFRAALEAGADREALARLAAEYVDYEEVARRSLGSLWGRQPLSDRRALVAALRALLEETYLAGLRPRAGAGAGASASAAIDVALARRAGREAEVRVVAGAGADRVPVVLALARGKDGRWRIHDAVVAGIAILEGYQQQFPQLLELGGMKRLLATLDEERRALHPGGGAPR